VPAFAVVRLRLARDELRLAGDLVVRALVVCRHALVTIRARGVSEWAVFSASL
jgi:hypothetical protein